MYVNEKYKSMIEKKVDKIKTKLWFSVVLFNAGASNASNLDKIIFELEFGSTEDYESKSDVWYRYERGGDVPRATTIDRIDKILHGTAFYFNHPFWSILSYQSYSFLEITKKIASSDASIVQKVLYFEEIGDVVVRRHSTNKVLLKKIENENYLDVLTVFFLLYSEAIDQNNQKKYLIFNFTERYIKKIILKEEFKHTKSIVFEFILKFFKSLELKNALNFSYKEDIEIYKKILIIPRSNHILKSELEACVAFNQIRDFYN